MRTLRVATTQHDSRDLCAGNVLSYAGIAFVWCRY